MYSENTTLLLFDAKNIFEIVKPYNIFFLLGDYEING